MNEITLLFCGHFMNRRLFFIVHVSECSKVGKKRLDENSLNPRARSHSTRRFLISLVAPYCFRMNHQPTHPAPYRRRLFLGKRLPPEVQSIIISLSGPLTWYINNLLTDDETENLAHEIWKDAIIIDWPGDLSILPEYAFPTMKTGLELVTSKSMYRRLCVLKPEKAILNIKRFKDEYNADKTWGWDLDEYSDAFHNDMIATVATYVFDYAIYSGNKKVVQILLTVDGINAGAHQNSALVAACQEGYLEIVKLLLARDDVDVTDQDNSPFRHACFSGNIELVKLLLTVDGVDPTDEGYDAIIISADQGHLEVVQLLVSLNAYDTASLNRALYYACLNENMEVINFLMAVEGFDGSASLNRGLIGSVRSDSDLAFLGWLLSLPSVDPSASDNSAIRTAAKLDCADIANMLLQTGRVDPSANDNEAIKHVRDSEIYKWSRLFWNMTRAQDNLALRKAAEKGHWKVVKVLLNCGREGIDAAVMDNYAIKKAAENGHAGVVEILLGVEEVDPTADDEYAARMAIINGHMKVLELLLTAGAIE
ncbi:hypothetical protein HDU76_004998 [Blyttiomyces sp. JEL0837]|nr:hypothetical protein HDU76_004998 [Blyttiomyces sp. JEL0837]